jgi:hypothetical protein
MDGEEKVLVGGGAKDVGKSPEFPVPKRNVTQVVGDANLQCDYPSNDIFGERFRPAEPRYLQIASTLIS